MRNGERVRIETDLVISNAGPKATVALGGEAAFPADYVARVRTGLRPAANIVINIASREPLISHPGIVTFGKTRRLCNMANLTATCPELAPPGWHLYVAYAVPIPALGDFDSDAEVELALMDLREQFPNFAQAKILSIRVMRDDWPAQRSCAGYDLPRETGIDGLWCVGDAVKQYGNGGTQACAETAKIVTDAILAQRPRLRRSRAARDAGQTIPTQAETTAGTQPRPRSVCLLEFRNIRIVYDNAIEAIRDVSIAVPQGGIVALLGSNGAGKSTLLKAMSGILYTEEGVIENGIDPLPRRGRASPRAG